MKLVTSFENPPIPWRKFDWIAYDDDAMSDVCTDPECSCRLGLARGWGATEEEAIIEFVRYLLVSNDVSLELIGASK